MQELEDADEKLRREKLDVRWPRRACKQVPVALGRREEVYERLARKR